MKKLILAVLITFSCSQAVLAGTCDTQLTQKKTYNYKKINQAFTCLNNQIAQLQNEIDIFKGFGTPEIYPKFTSVYFDLEVLSFIREKGNLLMKLKLTNKTGSEVWLYGSYSDSEDLPRIMDAQGHVCRYGSITNANKYVPTTPPTYEISIKFEDCLKPDVKTISFFWNPGWSKTLVNIELQGLIIGQAN